MPAKIKIAITALITPETMDLMMYGLIINHSLAPINCMLLMVKRCEYIISRMVLSIIRKATISMMMLKITMPTVIGFKVAPVVLTAISE